jgi:hypothetical protein
MNNHKMNREMAREVLDKLNLSISYPPRFGLCTLMIWPSSKPLRIRWTLRADFDFAMAMWDKHNGKRGYPISVSTSGASPLLQYNRNVNSPCLAYLELRSELAEHLYTTLKARWTNLGYIDL